MISVGMEIDFSLQIFIFQENWIAAHAFIIAMKSKEVCTKLATLSDLHRIISGRFHFTEAENARLESHLVCCRSGAWGFGILSIISSGSGDPSISNPTGLFITGVVLIVVAIVAIVIATRVKPATPPADNVTLNISLPGNVSMDTLKCKSCGGTLGPKDVQMVAGAPVVTCPIVILHTS